MSKPQQRPAAAKPAANQPARPLKPTGAQQEYTVPKPMLLLALVSLLVYALTFSFGLTDLDDSIFIRDFHEFNENLGNLTVAFQRGLFDATRDPYYRPLFMDSMILNYLFSDHGQTFVSYHVFNVIFHIVSVLLLYKLFLKLNIKTLHAFILTLLFAVHPVLTQAVAWIPGRNDTMLAMFILSFLLFAINYANEGRVKNLALSTLFLLLAFFTKETAVFAAPVAFVILVFILQKRFSDKRLIPQYVVWVGCFATWSAVRAAATVHTGISFSRVLKEFVPRLPVIIQYLGKIFLPINLSVFPTQEDTVYYYGIAALVLLGAIIYFAKEKNYRIILSGLAIFVFFLLPALLVPSNLNEQTFEHRLYLPMIGLLIMLSQTVLFKNNLKSKQLLTTGAAIAGVFAVINIMHQRDFTDPVTFWRSATVTTPHSAYANMMLAARLNDDQESYKLFHRAYELNPREKYLNFYYGVMLQKRDSVLQSKPFLLTEKRASGYYETDFYLARVAMEEKKLDSAIYYLQVYLKADPANSQANNNLLLLYMDTHQIDKAKQQAQHMKQIGLNVPAALRQPLSM